MIAVGGFRDERFRLNSSQIYRFHYFRDFSDRAVMSHFLKFSGNPSSSVTTTMFPEDDSYQRCELCLLFLEDGRLSNSPRMKRCPVDFKKAADLSDGGDVFGSDRIHGGVDIGYS
jgi:hypothetical protein